MRLGVGCLLLLFMALSIKEAVGSNEETDPKPPLEDNTANTKEDAVDPAKKLEKSEKKIKKRVLIYNPYIGYYHTKFMSTIAELLHKSGKYHVTMLDSIVDHKIKLIKPSKGIDVVTVDQHVKTRPYIDNGNELPEGLRAFWNDMPFVNKTNGFLFTFEKKVINFSDMLKHQCEKVVNSDEFKNLKEFGKFDLAITEVFDLCGVGLFQLLKPSKTILASSIPLHEFLGEILGLPKSFDVPTKFNIKTSLSHQKEFTVLSKRDWIDNAMTSAIIGQTMFGSLEEVQNAIFDKEIKEFPGLQKLLKKADSLIENVHPLLDLSKPTLNSIIPIGGITVEEWKPISNQEIVDTLEEAKKEDKKIVLVSFGTVMGHHTMTKEIMENLVKAFKEVESAVFLWKGKQELLEDNKIEKPDNVYINEWLPQNDLLASGKIDLFVSHMGIGSFTEAAYHGVPLVSVPIFVDQHYNYVCARRLGIARWVDKTTLANSSGKLSEAIKEALEDKIMTNTSTQLKSNLLAFGDQTKKMMDHINFIVSLPSDKISMAFHNYHEGVSIRSIYHLIPSRMAYIMAWTCLFFVQFLLSILFFCMKKDVKEDVTEDATDDATDDAADDAADDATEDATEDIKGDFIDLKEIDKGKVKETAKDRKKNKKNANKKNGIHGDNNGTSASNNGTPASNNGTPASNNGVKDEVKQQVKVEAKEDVKKDVKDIEGPVSKYSAFIFVIFYTTWYYIIDNISINYSWLIYYIPHSIIYHYEHFFIVSICTFISTSFHWLINCIPNSFSGYYNSLFTTSVYKYISSNLSCLINYISQLIINCFHSCITTFCTCISASFLWLINCIPNSFSEHYNSLFTTSFYIFISSNFSLLIDCVSQFIIDYYCIISFCFMPFIVLSIVIFITRRKGITCPSIINDFVQHNFFPYILFNNQLLPTIFTIAMAINLELAYHVTLSAMIIAFIIRYLVGCAYCHLFSRRPENVAVPLRAMDINT